MKIYYWKVLFDNESCAVFLVDFCGTVNSDGVYSINNNRLSLRKFMVALPMIGIQEKRDYLTVEEIKKAEDWLVSILMDEVNKF
jgi:hypothetical protein